ncbi:MAG: hypothetical protein WC763_02400 [Candidatus Paceibacterota bacterium]|jgi:hypothetical protein
MFESFRSGQEERVESMEEVFAKNKEEASRFVEAQIEADDREIDKGVFNLVVKLNQLPFLYTSSIGSCEGHLRLRPGATHGRFTAGYVHIQVDDSDEAMRFVDGIREIVARHPKSRMKDERDDPKWGGIGIDFYAIDNSYHVNLPREEAIQAEVDGKEMISEMEALAEAFLASK